MVAIIIFLIMHQSRYSFTDTAAVRCVIAAVVMHFLVKWVLMHSSWTSGLMGRVTHKQLHLVSRSIGTVCAGFSIATIDLAKIGR